MSWPTPCRKRPGASMFRCRGCAPSCARKATATQNQSPTKAPSASCRSCRGPMSSCGPNRPRFRSLRSARQYSGGRRLSRRDVRPLRLTRLSGRIQRWPPALRGASPWRPTSARRDDGLCRPPRARTWLRQRSGCRNYRAARCAPRADVRHDGGAEYCASSNGGWWREPRWQESKGSASSPLSGAARRQTLCRRTAFGQRFAHSIARGFSADRRPIRRARQVGIAPMTSFVFYRGIAHSRAPLREGPGEGAQATKLWQDKKDSLRLCPAVVLSLLVNMFAQAALSARSLYNLPKHCLNAQISTSSIGRPCPVTTKSTFALAASERGAGQGGRVLSPASSRRLRRPAGSIAPARAEKVAAGSDAAAPRVSARCAASPRDRAAPWSRRVSSGTVPRPRRSRASLLPTPRWRHPRWRAGKNVRRGGRRRGRSRLRRALPRRPASFPLHRLAGRRRGAFRPSRLHARSDGARVTRSRDQIDWVAIDHWNTEHPHIHVLARGRADDGGDLVISRDYISRGFRARAAHS